MSVSCTETEKLVRPHVRLHKIVGAIGIMLPFVLIIGSLVSSRSSPPGSISGYYYTDMRNFLVGGLCSLGVCLLASRGADKADGIAIAVAGSCVILVAFCPTKPLLRWNYRLTARQEVLGDLHDVFAITAFIVLGLIALRFAKRGRTREAILHRACAGVIFCCVLLAPLASRVSASAGLTWPPLLISEVLAMWASGISWLASGYAAGVTRPAGGVIYGSMEPSGVLNADLSEILEG
jgi:hypothetical protein